MEHWGVWRNELWVFVVAALVPFVLGRLAWARGHASGARAFAVMLFAQAAWISGQGVELWITGLAPKLWMDGLQYFPTALASLATLVFALRFSRLQVPRWVVSGYAIIALPLLLILFTSPLHGFGREQAEILPGEPFQALHYPFHAIDLVLTLLMLMAQVAAITILARQVAQSHGAFLRGTGLVLTGVALPVAASITSVALGVRLFGQRDLSFVFYGLAGGIIAWGMVRERVLSLVPVAREIIFDKVPDPVFVCDETGALIDLNQAAGRLLNRESEEVIGQSLDSSLGQILDLTAAMFAHEGQSVILKLEKQERFFESVWHHVGEDEGGKVFLLRDVTERHQELATATQSLRLEEGRRASAEDELRQAQKMDALGRLAGGVAHDFNNLLTVISANTELALLDAESEEQRATLEQIDLASTSAAALTRQLLIFGRKSVISARRIELQKELSALQQMLRRLIPENVELQFEIPDDVWAAKFDSSQLQQLLVNLVVNARDAMPNGGAVRVHAENVTRMAPGREPLRQEWVCLRVSDTGTGIKPEVLKQIFDPFFTTKEVGKGTGLGLAMVYGALAQHGGFVEVESDFGQGTTFAAYLPRDTQEPEENSERYFKSETRESHSFSGVALLVEDHDALRVMVARILGKAGFEVKSFASAEAFFSNWDELPRPELLLSDVVMPGCSGIELAERVEERWEGLPVLLMSGYSDDERLLLQVNQGRPFIAKPFRPPELLSQIAQIIRKSRQSEQSA